MVPLGRCFPRISCAAAFDHSHQFCINSSSNSLLTVYMYQYILVHYITRTRFSRPFQQCNLFVRAISISQDILDSVNTGTFPWSPKSGMLTVWLHQWVLTSPLYYLDQIFHSFPAVKSICLYCLWFPTNPLFNQYRSDCLFLHSLQASQLAKARIRYKVNIVLGTRSHISAAMQYIHIYWLRFSRYAVDSHSHNCQLLV